MMNKFSNPPAPLWRDSTYISLKVWSIFAMVGTVLYAVQGFAVTNGGILPAEWVEEMSKWGGVALALGCNGGTLAAVTEVCRRYAEKKAGKLDYAGVAVSFVASVFSWLLALSPMQTFVSMLILVVTAMADAYGTYAIAGLYKAEYAVRVERWLLAKELYDRNDWQGAWRVLAGASVQSQGEAQLRQELRKQQAQSDELRATIKELNATIQRQAAQLAEQATPEPEAPSTPRKAEYSDFARLTAGMNGALSAMTAGDAARLLDEHRLMPPSPNTLREWKRKAVAERAQ